MRDAKNMKRYVICLDNSDYPASLEVRKLYECISDDRAEGLGQVRVIDESGEDYLYPSDRFVSVELSDEAAEAVARAA